LEPNYNGLSEEQVVNLGPQAHSMQHERVLATSSTLAARLARFGKAASATGLDGTPISRVTTGTWLGSLSIGNMDPIKKHPQWLTIIRWLGFQPSNWGLWHWVYHINSFKSFTLEMDSGG